MKTTFLLRITRAVLYGFDAVAEFISRAVVIVDAIAAGTAFVGEVLHAAALRLHIRVLYKDTDKTLQAVIDANVAVEAARVALIVARQTHSTVYDANTNAVRAARAELSLVRPQ